MLFTERVERRIAAALRLTVATSWPRLSPPPSCCEEPLELSFSAAFSEPVAHAPP